MFDECNRDERAAYLEKLSGSLRDSGLMVVAVDFVRAEHQDRFLMFPITHCGELSSRRLIELASPFFEAIHTQARAQFANG